MNEYWKKLEKILPLVDKPGRYIGGEVGEIRKEHHGDMLRFALAFPEIYEIGASHHGGQILYHIVNAHPKLICERVYCPWRDLSALLREKKIPLLSLESKTPITEFDVVGFSLEYELSYTNVLEMLDLAGLPLLSKDRREEHPLIIAGGPSAFSPEPIADIIDAFIIGDAEEALPELLETIRTTDLPRSKLLHKLTQQRGVYVPMFYKPRYEGDLQDGFELCEDVPYPIRSIELPELPSNNYETKPIIPWVEPVHDRLSLEIMRGCGRGCRFCSAGWIYRPVRERSVEDICNEVLLLSVRTGYEEIGLLSLSTSDYSNLRPLLARLNSLVENEVISISVPSLRPDGIDSAAISILSKVRKSSMTFAPEAGTERLRAVINKQFDEGKLFDTITAVFSAGWRTVKLYFMVGLPTETDEDILGIADLCRRAYSISKRYRAQLNVSISPFIPKGHTPFAWEAQASPNEIDRKYRILRNEIPNRVKLTTRDPYLARIEAVLSRSDRRIGKALLEIWRTGGGYDAWNESFNSDAWFEAFEKADIRTEWFADEQKPERIAPWEIVDKGIPKQFLLAEKAKAYRVEYSPSCSEREGCEACGICDFTPVGKALQPDYIIPGNGAFGRRAKKVRKSSSAGNTTLRLRYSRNLSLRWLGHLDITRAISRAIRRSRLNIAYSEGHHRHQKISYGPPLPVGYASRAEYMDIEFDNTIRLDDINDLETELPDGLAIIDNRPLMRKTASICAATDSALFSVEIPRGLAPDFPAMWEALSQSEIPFERRKKTVNLKSFLKHYQIIDLDNHWLLRILLQCDSNGAGRPDEYLRALGILKAEVLVLPLVREELLIGRGEGYFNPMGQKWSYWEENIVKEPNDDRL